MAKKIKKFMSMMLVLCMMVSMFSVTVFASNSSADEFISDNGNDSSLKTEQIVEGDLVTDVTTTTTTSTDENGNVTVNVSIEKVTTGTDENGATVNGKEVREETTVTDEAGEIVSEDWVVDGSETKEWVEEDNGDGVQPSVTAPVVPGESATGTATSKEEIENADGSVTTITTTDRTVTANTSDTKVTVNEVQDGLVGEQDTEMKGVSPVYDEVNGEKVDKDGMFDANYLKDAGKYSDYANWDIPEGGEYRFIGVGEHCKYYTAHVYVEYEKDEAGNTIFDENGKPVIKDIRAKEVSGSNITVDGKDATELGDADFFNTYQATRLTSYALMDAKGNIVGAYCCDKGIPTVDGAWYSVSNLDDSDYYASEDAKEHIRAIALNGYWGTSNVPKENGDYELGSLESVKQKLKEAIANGEIAQEYETYLYSECSAVCGATCTKNCGKLQYDKDGNPMTFKVDMLSIIDNLTEGEALLATQSAIWSYSNGCQGVLSGVDGDIIVDVSSRGNFKRNNSDEPLDNNGNARVEFLYNWLISLKSEEETTTVINDKNFVKDMSITVHDKVADHANNADTNNDNDVYNTDLNFKLAFIPGDKDDLLVQISYIDLDGNVQNIVKRLAGKNAEGQNYEDIKPEADGSYVLKGLKLSENEDFDFDLRLEGTQYLENGVYLYSALGGRKASQTFVSIAEGSRNVDVSVGMTISFDVDENNHVVAERKWHDEADPEVAPVAEPAAGVFAMPARPLNNIPDEEVPLADAPQTGDEAIVFAVLTVLAGISLMAMHVSEKKRKEEV